MGKNKFKKKSGSNLGKNGISLQCRHIMNIFDNIKMSFLNRIYI